MIPKVPQGTTLQSQRWGQCLLVRDASMRPGTKVLVKGVYGQLGDCFVWKPAEDFTLPSS